MRWFEHVEYRLIGVIRWKNIGWMCYCDKGYTNELASKATIIDKNVSEDIERWMHSKNSMDGPHWLGKKGLSWCVVLFVVILELLFCCYCPKNTVCIQTSATHLFLSYNVSEIYYLACLCS